MHLGMAFHFGVTVTLTLTSDLFFVYNNRVLSISLILLGVGIPNLEWVHFGVEKCRIPFWVTVTLTSDLACQRKS